MFRRFSEPFLGSGAVFFDLHNFGRLNDCEVRLQDRNPDLIGCYAAVRDQPDAVIAALTQLAAGHAQHGADHYYAVRNRQFNPARHRLGPPEEGSSMTGYPPELAAMLIYLNRTGYNGLYRLNSKGDFNVPAGRYTHPRICDPDLLGRVGDALRRPNVSLRYGTFDAVPPSAGPEDFFYFDPPYAPLSSTARFTAYTSAGFGLREQIRLRDVICALAMRNSMVLLSNSSTPEIARLYDGSVEAAAAGLKAHHVAARRAINSRGGRRGPISEFLITNIEPNPDARSLKPVAEARSL